MNAPGTWTPGLAGDVLDEVIVRLARMASEATKRGDHETAEVCTAALGQPTVLGAVAADIIQSRGGKVRPTLTVIEGGRP